MEYEVSFRRRLLHYGSVRRFNFFELVLIVLITVTFYTVVLTCVGTNSNLFCSLGHGSVGSVSYVNFKDYTGASCESKYKTRIDESKRVLGSVKSELSRVSKKMKEIHLVTDELNREIPEKRQKIVELDEEIGAAERRYNELKETKNVQVFLPNAPLFNNQPLSSTSSAVTSFDYSRCSISTFMPIFLEDLTETDETVVLLHQEFNKKANLVGEKEKACLTITVTSSPSFLSLTAGHSNRVVISTKTADNLADIAILFHPGKGTSPFGSSLHLQLEAPDTELWKKMTPLLPYKRTNLALLYLQDETLLDQKILDLSLFTLQESGKKSDDKIKTIRCGQKASRTECTDKDSLASTMRASIFCVLTSSTTFQENFWMALQGGCIPVVMSDDQALPFENFIDWRLAAIRLPLARLPELHFRLRGLDPADLIEMKRMGRVFFEKYLADVATVSSAILFFLTNRLSLLLPQETVTKSVPLFEDSYVPKLLSPANRVIAEDDEYLGPLEAPLASESFRHNFTTVGMYGHRGWNSASGQDYCPEFMKDSVELPAEAEFYEDTKAGYRPISPGTGEEFSKALGGNRQREQFTVVVITYNRDDVLVKQLERLNKMPYLNKVLVIWNNVGREPVGAWPKIHVPVEFIKVSKNSLNNRFEPWDRIETEAVLSLDDDISLRQHEINFAFRTWREARDQIVGFPARYHARYGEDIYYNSNHTCQYSMILTGAAFLHKSYFYEYSRRMMPAIRDHVDKIMNCEDIAMNFLVSHLIRKPPIKTTSKWTIRCPDCPETLSQDESHFQERHECIRLFTKMYGYNPLKFTQFRADSVLFKTRLGQGEQKCYKYV